MEQKNLKTPEPVIVEEILKNSTKDVNNIIDKALAESRDKAASLGDGMKVYEDRPLEKYLPHDRPFLVRLDGHSFSKFTKKFKDFPFDNNFTKLMVTTSNQLLNDQTFHPRMVYTHSDEITLVFDYQDDIEMPFNGRTDKFLSLLSSKTSSIFQKELTKYASLTNQSQFDNANPAFDARIIYFPKDRQYEIVNYFLWRSQRDSPRNYIAQKGRYHFGKKAVHGKNSKDILQMFVNDTDPDVKLDVTDSFQFHGYYIKKGEPLKDVDINISETKNVCFSLRFGFNEKLGEIFTSKYFEKNHQDLLTHSSSEINVSNLKFTDVSKYTFDDLEKVKSNEDNEVDNEEDDECYEDINTVFNYTLMILLASLTGLCLGDSIRFDKLLYLSFSIFVILTKAFWFYQSGYKWMSHYYTMMIWVSFLVGMTAPIFGYSGTDDDVSNQVNYKLYTTRFIGCVIFILYFYRMILKHIYYHDFFNIQSMISKNN